MRKNQRVSATRKVPRRPRNVLTKPSHTKRTIFIALGVIIILFLGVFIYNILARMFQDPMKESPLPKLESTTSGTQESSLTPTPVALSADFVSYNDLSGKEKFAVAYNFSDPILDVGFAYPPGYNVQSLKADEKDTTAAIFFTRSVEAEEREHIRDVIDCMQDNREEPGDLCREGYFGDVEVTIQPSEQHENAGFFEDGQANCRRDIDTKNRVLFSCEEQLSPSVEDQGMQYVLYLLGENPLFLKVSARDAKEQAHLIRSVISSATNHL